MASKDSKKLVLYGHDGSGNHGCEALVRTTAALCEKTKDEIILLSTRPEEDIKYGLDDICVIVDKSAQRDLNRKSINFLRAYIRLKLQKNYDYIDFHTSRVADYVKRGDIALSIGGDTYCYGAKNALLKAHKKFKFAGLKTVYWGCSIEPELLDDPEIAEDIKKFDLITAREGISYDALKKVNPNTVPVCDSAFFLPTKDVTFPKEFQNKPIVGINASPLVEDCENSEGSVHRNYENLIEHILQNTDMNIALIPHVVWDAVDDRKVLNAFYEKYKDSKRIFIVGDCTCEELKGYISKCRFFVGARTHSTIAAYSTCVPTVVVGYSVKARGIARDLFGTDENYVLPAQGLKNDDELKNAFEFLRKNEDEIKSALKNALPQYKQRIYDGLNALKTL